MKGKEKKNCRQLNNNKNTMIFIKKNKETTVISFHVEKSKTGELYCFFFSKTHDYLLTRPHLRRKDFSPSLFSLFCKKTVS